ncbi:MAG: DedA family protein [Candidatus Dormibacteria bacterium]
MYLFILAWLAAESVGVPLPDEAVLLTLGYLVHKGTVDLAPAIACAFAGAVIGSTISYQLGLTLGRPVVARIAGRLGIRAGRLEEGEAWMRRRGGPGVFLTRILPIARNVASWAAGIAGIPRRVFFPAMVSGSLLWSVTVISVGDALGAHYRDVLHMGGLGILVGLGAVVLVVVAWIAWRVLRRRRGARPPAPG